MLNKYKIILGCVLFNLILEYWVHGIPNFFIIFPSLFLLYVTYFFMLEDLILRYHLKDYQVLLIGFVFGVYTEIFSTGSIFGSGYFFGIDPFYFFLSTIGWWGLIQSVLTMNFANRFIAIRDWTEEPSGKLLWILAVGWHVFMFLGFLSEQMELKIPPLINLAGQNLPKRTLMGYITSAIILIIVLTLYFIIQKIRGEKSSAVIPIFEKSKFLDVLTIGSIIISLVLGTTLFGSELSRVLFVYYSIIIGIIFIIYRLNTKKGVCV
ncbi:MAG: hypothetical protein ACFFDN_14205 [Candidatus Hodarchaeota archaeon]